MSLEVVWFCAIGVLWGGYFVLEGFDFGVGILLPFLSRDEDDRSKLLATIGPHWDGNEVWLVIAAGATFAAFPAWYATMFSAFYLVLLLILVLLIVRVLSFEWRERGESDRWRGTWRWANTVSSIGAPFLWGVALANLVYGIPLDGNGDFTGDVLDLFNPYTVAAGVAVTLLFALHGATFLSLRAEGDLRARARDAARRLSVPVAVVVAGFLAWTVAVAVDRNDRDVLAPLVPAAVGGVALVLGLVFALRGRSGWAFAMSATCVARDRRNTVHGALPARAGVRAEPAEQPDDRRRGDGALRAHGDHRGRRRDAARDGALPGLDLPRVPRAAAASAGRVADELSRCRPSTDGSSAVPGRCARCSRSTPRWASRPSCRSSRRPC